ncbi:MAG: DUF2225 domain-containing protein [Lachnospiraceae bacterium]|nr:DUF2225 domain-containing protein [Lachnospiraceae bacterium]
MSILSGLESYGLDTIIGADLYEKEQAEEFKKIEDEQRRIRRERFNKYGGALMSEDDYVFLKSQKCPCCYKDFKNTTMRSNKARLVSQDLDLRPRYNKIDPVKYDVISCPHCGYSALSRFFDKLTSPQAKLIKADISSRYKPVSTGIVLSYDEAYSRYQLSLGNAIVKKAKPSEKAYICLKMAWIMRGKYEELEKNSSFKDPGMTGDKGRASESEIINEIKDCKEAEQELLEKAFEGFMDARQNEISPICGMDNITLDYLLSALAYETKNREVAAKLVSQILIKQGISSRIKDNARALKDMIIADIKNEQG